MAKKWKQPKLVLGHLEVVTGADMESAIPYDEAVIHLEGDEDSEIEIRCPGAYRFAPIIVKAVNNHEAMTADLAKAVDLLDGLLGLEKGSGQAALEFVEQYRARVGGSGT